MSEKVNKMIACPKCSEKSETELICSMNNKSFPDMKKRIFGDKFFEWKCSKCGFHGDLLHPLLYNDMKNKFMVYYIPDVKRKVIADEKLEKEFAECRDIKKRLVSGVNELKEKIAVLDAGADDMAVELAKYAVERIVEKSANRKVISGYFLDMDKSENTISFHFYVGNEKRPYIQTTRLEVYNRSMKIVKDYFEDFGKQPGFIKIDREWAKEAWKIYKNS